MAMVFVVAVVGVVAIVVGAVDDGKCAYAAWAMQRHLLSLSIVV